MQLERRALYNLMRLNWLHHPDMAVEPWQVDDYRAMSVDALFERLRLHDLDIDRPLFVDLADQCDSPEDFTDAILVDMDADTVTQDQVYLLVFELWRRLLPEKPCLSIFCDELDHQVHNYDSGESVKVEEIQDAVANLQSVLDENTDAGADPLEVFQSISHGCANDIETFLYDYITDQIETGNQSYAQDLLDGFHQYVKDVKWFDFLRVRSLTAIDQEIASEMSEQLVQEAIETPDLEFNLELLAFLVQIVDRTIFVHLVKKTISLLQTEEDFQDLLTISIDFFHRLDLEKEENLIRLILRKRMHLHQEGVITQKDPSISEFLSILG